MVAPSGSTQMTSHKKGSGREILTKCLKEVIKKPLFVSSAEKEFSKLSYLQENLPALPKLVRGTNSQTDAFLPQPPAKGFLPKKIGFDSCVQVETSLVFNFDSEVSPLVNSLVSKTIDQAALEVQEETTLAKIRAFKAAAASRRDAEITTWETMVSAEAARRAVAEAEAKRLAEVRAAQASADRRESLKVFAKKYLESLIPSTLGRLRQDFGVFENEKTLDIERKFLPSLLENVRAAQHQLSQAESLARSLVKL